MIDFTIPTKRYFHFFILLGVYMSMHFFLFKAIGIKVVNDSPRYLEYAQHILNDGFYYEDHNFWYVGYVLFVAVIRFFSTDITNIIIAQIVFYGLTSIVIFKLSICLFKEYETALFTAFLFLAYSDLVRWNFYVLCESFYGCGIVWCFYALVSESRKPLRFFTWGSVLFVFLCKPSGIALLIAFGIANLYEYRFLAKKINVKSWILISIVMCVGGYGLLNQMLSTFILVENFQTGELVYAVSTYPDSFYYKRYLLINNEHLYIPSHELAPLLRLSSFIVHNPFFFLKLSLGKLFLFLSNLKPYYSWGHIVYVVFFLYPLYFFGIRAFIQIPLHKSLKVFFLSYFLLHCLIVMLTVEDWDGRFSVPLLPLFFLFGAKGISVYVRQQLCKTHLYVFFNSFFHNIRIF